MDESTLHVSVYKNVLLSTSGHKTWSKSINRIDMLRSYCPCTIITRSGSMYPVFFWNNKIHVLSKVSEILFSLFVCILCLINVFVYQIMVKKL